MKVILKLILPGQELLPELFQRNKKFFWLASHFHRHYLKNLRRGPITIKNIRQMIVHFEEIRTHAVMLMSVTYVCLDMSTISKIFFVKS